jgi:hypothetical protein
VVEVGESGEAGGGRRVERVEPQYATVSPTQLVPPPHLDADGRRVVDEVAHSPVPAVADEQTTGDG